MATEWFSNYKKNLKKRMKIYRRNTIRRNRYSKPPYLVNKVLESIDNWNIEDCWDKLYDTLIYMTDIWIQQKNIDPNVCVVINDVASTNIIYYCPLINREISVPSLWTINRLNP